MTIEELITEKLKLQVKIAELINQFESSTGVWIKDILLLSDTKKTLDGGSTIKYNKIEIRLTIE